jgi:hypothetical protein
MNSSDGLARIAPRPQGEGGMLAPTVAPLFVVRIVERCEPKLTGRKDLTCQVPPQSLIDGGRQVITVEALR